ncbi:hypothetical protein AGMMS49975_18330 [Clostridia bacterium]|nr:hypothetical protein AGMMS49975_18330 [Clostridia bacterium]
MNRIEIIGLFSSLDRFLKKGDIESVEEVVREVLREARGYDKDGNEKKEN